MALNPNTWTIRTQEAVSAAMAAARDANNPELTPAHLLSALLDQEGSVVGPVLEKLGTAPLMVRNRMQEQLAKLPKAYGGSEPRLSREATAVFDEAERTRKELHDDYLSVEHLLLSMASLLGVGREELLSALASVRGSHRVTSQNPEDQYQALEKYGRDLTK